MTQTTDTTIRTRKDGSIDTAYYLARGRKIRSDQAGSLTVSMLKAIKSGASHIFQMPERMVPRDNANRFPAE